MSGAAFDHHLLRSQQAKPPVGSCRQRVDVKMRFGIIGPTHHRRWSGDDFQRAACTDPIDMAMTMHHDSAVAQYLELTDEPAAVNQRGADALGKPRYRHRILHQMVMQCEDPPCPRKSVDCGREPT